ncbi:MAG: hypothetical protein ACRCXT_23865 [Paraclostridium sp.]
MKNLNNGLETLRNAITNRINNDASLTDRKKKNRIKKELQQIEDALNEPVLKEARIDINWKRSANWGMNPHLTVRFTDINDKTFNAGAYKCSGCGYDKKSTVFAEMMNSLFLNMILENIDKIIETENLPYGLSNYIERGFLPSFEGGAGMNCYYSILEFLGYELEQTTDLKDYDVFYITRK